MPVAASAVPPGHIGTAAGPPWGHRRPHRRPTADPRPNGDRSDAATRIMPVPLVHDPPCAHVLPFGYSSPARGPCPGPIARPEGDAMGIFEKARQAAEQVADATRQAADEARLRAEGAAATLSDPTTQEKAKQALDSAGKQTKVGLGHARRGISTAIDRIDPNILADMIIKATSLQEKANAALRDQGSPYRVAEIGIAASIPPQVTFSIGRIDDPEQAPPAADLIESDRAARGLAARRHGDHLPRRDGRPRPRGADDRASRRLEPRCVETPEPRRRPSAKLGPVSRRSGRSARPRRRRAAGSSARRSPAR